MAHPHSLRRISTILGSTLFVLALTGLLATLLPPSSVYAAPTLRLKLELAPGTPNPIPSGEPFRVRLTYECSSSIGTDECVNMQVTSTLPSAPSAFDGLQVLGNNDVTLASYDPDTQTATWDFRSPLPLGTTGQLEFEVRYVPGTTLDGTTGTITASISDGVSAPATGGITPPPADASAQPTVSKTLVAGGASDDLSIYHVDVCAGNAGALDLTNTTVVDTLPPGATYVESTPIGAYDAGAGTVTWGPLTVEAPGCTTLEVVVNYPSGTNNVGDTKTNGVSVTTTPFDGVEQTISTSVTHELVGPIPGLRLQKSAVGAEGTADTIVGGVVTTNLTVDNIGTNPDPLSQGNVTISNVQIVDPIPAEQDVFEIDTGEATAVAYQRNGDATWITGVPTGSSVAVISFPSWTTGDYVSNLRFSFDPLTLLDRTKTVTIRSKIINPPHGSGSSYPVTAASPYPVENTATASATFGGTALTDQSSTATIEVAVPKARPDPRKTIISGSPALPEGTVTYELRLRNGAFAPLENPVIADLLPTALIFDPLSVAVTKNITGCAAAPTFSQVDNYNSSGLTLLLWSWAGSGCSIPADDDATIEFSVTVKEGTRAGQYANRLALVNTSTTPDLTRTSLCASDGISESSIFTTDAGLGIDTTRLCFSDPSNLTVRAIASIGSAKFVKGQLDTAFSRDPIVGATVQGGLITYQLELENTGNIDLTNLQIVDILPFNDGTSQNQGVRDQDLLGTAWTVQLAGPVTVTPAVPGLEISYSSELNPCRPTLTVTPDPACTPMVDGSTPGAGVWSTDMPSDPTAVRSIKFNFGSYTLLPVKILRFTFPAFAPVDAPIATAGTDGIPRNSDDTNVAWNTFAYEATRADDGSTLVAQPPRVGIEVQTPPAGLASYGNYVWHDVNQNGQQDEPDYRGLNGVTVNLYQPGPDGLAGTDDDILVGTQITRDDVSGDPGYYLFNALEPGDYFAEFEQPDGYTVTTRDSVADTSDSDIDPATLRTAITSLAAGENDITWDAGFYASSISLGNRLWYDTNNDGLDNDGALNALGSSNGISTVTVQLFLDADGNGFLTGNEQNWIAEATTDPTGFYLFTEQTRDSSGTTLGSPVPLFPAQYLVGIPASQFSGTAPLVGYYSSGTTMSAAGSLTELAAPDPDTGPDGLAGGGDDDRDRDDNGDTIRVIAGSPVPNPFDFYDGGVISKPVFVDSNEQTGEPESAGTAPGGGAIADASSNLTIDFGFYTASLGNLVWIDDGRVGGTLADGIRNGGESGISGVTVRLLAQDGSEIAVGPDGLLGTTDDALGGVTTDASGNYAFGRLPQGSYTVKIDRPAGYVSTLDRTDTSAPNTNTDNEDNGVGSSQTATTISSKLFTLEPGNELTVTTATGSTDDPSIDFGIVRYYSLGNRVWRDINNNGMQDTGEIVIPNVTLRLLQSNGSTLAKRIDGTNVPNQTTNANGFYRFDLLPAGDYIVEVLAGEFTTGGDLVGFRSSTNGTATAGPFEPAPDPDDDPTDKDDNGTVSGAVVRSAIVTLGEGSGTAEPTADTDGGTTGTTEAPDDQSNRTVDFGFWPTFSLGNLVWDDLDNNGVVNGNGTEAGLNGVTVNLYRDSLGDGIPDGAVIATMPTANGGYYLFTDLIADTYIVEIVPPAGYRGSTGDANAYEPGPDADTVATDNDDNGTASGAVIRSAPVTLSLSSEPTGEPATPGLSDTARDNNGNYTVDFGIFQPISLGNLVWADLDNNGQFDSATESGISSSVTVRLYRDSAGDGTPDGAAIATATTNATGNYLFTDLGADTYIVEVVNPAGMVSSSGQSLPAPYEPGPDVDGNITDNDDNGTRGTGVARSAPITLALGGEPTGEPATPGIADTALFVDANANYTADFGFYTALSLGNRVWNDANNNGIIDDGASPGIDDVPVRLYRDGLGDGLPDDLNGDTTVDTADSIATVTTAGGGYYLFTNLSAGNYIVEIVPPSGYRSSIGAPVALGLYEPAPDPDDLPENDNDDNGSESGAVIRSKTVSLSVAGEPTGESDTSGSDPTADNNSNLTVDFGIYNRVALGDLIFIDNNNNGVFDAGDSPLQGATVALFASDGSTPAVDGDGVAVSSPISDANGFYSFPNLNPGSYVVRVTPPSGYFSSGDLTDTPNPNSDTNNDDNGIGSNISGPVSSGVVTLTSGGEPTNDGDADSNTNLTLDFGFYRPVSLGNQVWYDSNNSRTIDGAEAGIAGVKVELFYDADHSGAINGGETTPIAVDTTDASGTYLFTEYTDADGASLASPRPLNPGTYVVGIPASQLAPAGVLGGLFSSGTTMLATGTADEVTPDDPDTGGTTAPDGDDNGKLQTGVGFYTGGVLAPPVTLTLDGEPTGESPDVDPNPAGRPDASDNQTVDFGFYAMSLGNRVWLDDGSGSGISNDGIRNGSEAGIAGVTVRLIAQNGTTVVATTTTDVNGRYLFTGLAEGIYLVEVDHTSAPIAGLDSSRDPANANSPDAQDDDDNGVTLTANAVRSQPITLDAGAMPAGETDQAQSVTPGMGNPAQSDNALTPDANSDLHIDFGFVPADWGDLPDGSAGLPSYNTDRIGTEGPHHPLTTGLGIGANIDAETNGQPDATATGDDTTGAPDDEDGVTLPTFYTGMPADVTVAVNNSTGRAATLYGFIDFNRNGSFADTGEQVSVAVPNGTSGNLTLTFNVPNDAVFGTSIGARFRLSSDTGLGPNGPASDGEVEDYLTSVTPTYSLGNRVWHDLDNDGTINAADGITPGVDGVSVRLLTSAGDPVTDAAGTTVADQVTSGGGYYRFDKLLVGNYIVEVVSGNFAAAAKLDGLFSSTGAGQEADPDSDGDSNDNGLDGPVAGAIRSAVITLGEGGGAAEPTSDNDPATNPEAGEAVDNRSNRTVDFGFISPVRLGNLIFNDRDNNGKYDGTDIPLADVVVKLFLADGTTSATDITGTPVADQTTGADGFYLFDNLVPGEYVVSLLASNFTTGGALAATATMPAYISSTGTNGSATGPYEGTALADPDVTVLDGDDSGTTDGSGNVKSLPVTLTSQGEPDTTDDTDDTNGNLTLDFGVFRPLSLGNLVWQDLNNNGAFDSATESGIDGVSVDLYLDNGDGSYGAGDTFVATTTTDGSGVYGFTNLIPGDYVVVIPASNFTGPLSGFFSSSGTNGSLAGDYEGAALADPDGDIDNDDDGSLTGGDVVSLPVTLAVDSEPDSGVDGDHKNGNQTVDFGFFKPARLGNFVWDDVNANGVQDSGEVGVDGVTVTLYDNSTNALVASITTAGGGLYSFDNLIPGNYTITFSNLPPGYTFSPTGQGTNATDSDASPTDGSTAMITLTAGQTDLDWDAGIYHTLSLGNLVWDDLNNDGAWAVGEPGIDGMTVELRWASDNSLVDSTFTTGGGFYQFSGLAQGDYIVVLPASNFSAALSGYRSSTGAHSLTAGPSEPAPDPDDPTGAPAANDRDNDDNGSLSLISGDIQSAPVHLSALGEPDTDGDDKNGNLTVDFGLFKPASIGDRVWEDADGNGVQDAGELGVSGVSVRLYDVGADGIPGSGEDLQVDSTTTDGSGVYGFSDLPPASYYLVFDKPAGYFFTRRDAGTDDAMDSDADRTSGATDATVLISGESDDSWDAGINQLASLGDTVWEDMNHNGVQDAGEPGVPGVTVTLYDVATDKPVGAAQTTDADGFYQFISLAPGRYYVIFSDLPTGYLFTPQGQGGDSSKDSDADPASGQTADIDLTSSQDDPTWDAGIYTTASLGDRVWNDTNANGVQDAGEVGVNGVTVTLYQADGTLVGSATTKTVGAEDGVYGFSGLTPGNYYLVFSDLPAGYIFSPADRGGDDGLDSDADRVSGQSATFAIASGANDLRWDAGIYLPASLGNFIWDDANANGVQDAGEVGVDGVTVKLIQGGTVISTTTTASDGSYHFRELGAGDYQIEIVPPAGRQISPPIQGGDTATDSDIDRASGQSGTVSLTPGEVNDSLDGGIYQLASVGNRVWEDSNHDGIFDPGEAGIAGVTVELYRSDGTLVASAVTDSTGTFIFTDLEPGDYYIQFYPTSGWVISPQDRGSDNGIDSDVNPNSGQTIVFTLGIGVKDMTWWAGMSRPPTAITLQSFTLERQRNGNLLRWETGAEINSAGFEIYRSATGSRADAEQVSGPLILASGVGGGGARYSWLDRGADPQVGYSYWLVEVEIGGARHEYELAQPALQQEHRVYLPLVVR